VSRLPGAWQEEKEVFGADGLTTLPRIPQGLCRTLHLPVGATALKQPIMYQALPLTRNPDPPRDNNRSLLKRIVVRSTTTRLLSGGLGLAVLGIGASAARKLLVIFVFQLVRSEYYSVYAFWGARKAASAVGQSSRARGGSTSLHKVFGHRVANYRRLSVDPRRFAVDLR
jgi:hypothetical protein